MLQAIAGLKVSIQLQSPHFDVGDRPTWSLPGGAGRGVCSDQLHSEQDIWSEYCQNPRQSSRQPKTTRATAHQSDTGPQYLWRHQRNFGVREGSSLKKKTGKKASRWGFLSFRVRPAGWPGGLQSILNKLDSAFIDLNKLNLNKCLEKLESICSVSCHIDWETFSSGNGAVWLITKNKKGITFTANLSASC